MEVTIEELIRIPLLSGSKIIAGYRGRNRIVKALTMLDGYSGHAYTDKDMLAVSSGYFLSREPEKHAELIRNLVKHELAGITLKGVYFNDQVPESITRIADELDFPVILLADRDLKFYPLFEFFYSHVFSRSTNTYLRLDNAMEIMKNAMNTGGMSGLTKQLHAWTGKPALITLQESLLNCVSVEDPPPLCAALAEHASGRFSLPDGEHKGLVRFCSPAASGLGIPFRFRNDMEGMIWLDETAHPCDDNDAVLLTSAKAACEVGIIQIMAYEHDEALLKASFIEDLISGKLQSLNEAVLRMQSLNWCIPRQVQVLIVKCQDDPDLYQQMGVLIENLFNALKLKIIVCLYKQSLIILLPANLENRTALLEDMDHKLGSNWPNHTFNYALGRVMDFRDARMSYKQAGLALKINPLLHQERKFISFDDLGLYRFCYPDGLNAEIALFCRDIVTPLMDIDNTLDINLIETLQVFFRHRFNYSRTGQELSIHPNTVRYRLEVVEKLCHINFDNYEDVLNLQVALAFLPVVTPEAGKK